MNTSNTSAGQIRSYVERAERVTEEIRELNSDKAEIFKEAKGNGYCTKTLKILIKRLADPTATAEADAILDLYESALASRAPAHEGA